MTLLKFPVPFSIILAGPSGCGKSTFAHNILNNLQNLTDTKFSKIIWCFSENGSVGNLPKLENLEVFSGIPDNIGNDSEHKTPKLVVIDDLMTSKEYEPKICDLFIKESHHRNISIIFICQNIFYQSRFARTISLNSKYLTVFRNVRDKSQFMPLARQLHPENPVELLNIYKECTSKPYGYLFIDLNQETPDALRFRTNIFDDNFATCFCTSEQLNLLRRYREDETESKEFQTIGGEQAYVVYT